jgi:hypothetical protein
MHPSARDSANIAMFSADLRSSQFSCLEEKLTVTTAGVVLVDAAGRRTVGDLFIEEASTGQLSASIKTASTILKRSCSKQKTVNKYRAIIWVDKTY